MIFSFIGCSNSTNNKGTSEAENNSNKKTTNNSKNQENEQSTKDLEVKIAGLKGPTSIGMIKLFENPELIDKDAKISIAAIPSPDQVVSNLLNGDLDIAALPTNVAAKVYNKTEGKYKLAGINTYGVLYILTNNSEIKSIEDLKDKKISISGKGSTPDFVLNYLLTKNGLDPEKDVEINYLPSHNEVAQGVIAGDIEIAVIPQPFVTMVTMQNKDIKISLDLQEEWKKVDEKNSNLMMGCIVVKSEFADKYPEFLESFLSEYDKSVKWVNENPKEAGILVENHGILPKAKIAELAIPKCNIVYVNAEDSKASTDAFLKVLHSFDPASVGGKLPDEGFYYKK
jgi:NitT/TauT family transport system substrate-binding protein